MKYKLLTIYDNITTKTEDTDDFRAALSAAAIYLDDRDVIGVKIWDIPTGKIILDYWRN